jgi:hypothetical protein
VTTTDDMIKSATSIAREVAEGRLSPADLERQAVQELSALMLVEPDANTELWQLQTEVARRVLARGALPADEVAEWAAVQRRRENPDADTDSIAVAAVVALEPSEGPDVPQVQDSAATAAHSPENEPAPDDPVDVGPEPTAEPVPAGFAEPAPITRGPKFGGHIAALGRGLPNGGRLTDRQ